MPSKKSQDSVEAQLEEQLAGGSRTLEEAKAAAAAPKVQLGQSNIDERTSADEAQDRAIVQLAEAKAEEQDAARAEALEQGRKALAKQQQEARKAGQDRQVVARFYLANPQHRKRIYRPNSAYPLVFRNGVLTVYSEEDAQLVRDTQRGIAFEEDFPEDKAVPFCKTCGYAPRSFAAFAAHQDAHPLAR